MHEQHHPVVGALLELIRALRADQGMTHEDLADRANIHRTTVGLLERGERTPSVEVAASIANALGYPLSELLQKAELIAEGKLPAEEAFAEEHARTVPHAALRNEANLV